MRSVNTHSQDPGAPAGVEVALVGESIYPMAPTFHQALAAEGHSASLLFSTATEVQTAIIGAIGGYSLVLPDSLETMVVYGSVSQKSGKSEEMTPYFPDTVRQFILDALIVYVSDKPLTDRERGRLMSGGYSALVEFDPIPSRQATKAAKMITTLLAGPQRVIYPTLYTE